MVYFFAKMLMLLVIIVVCGPAWFDAIYDRQHLLFEFGISKAGIAYVVAIGIVAAAFFAIPFVKPTLARVVFSVFVMLGVAVEYAFFAVTASNLNAGVIETMWDERGAMGGAALNAYLPILTKAAILFAAGVIVFGFLPPRWASLKARFASLPAIAITLVLAITIYTKGGLSTFPPFSALTSIVVAAASAKYSGARDSIVYDGPIQPKIANILFIVDESVRSDYLGFNDPSKSTTPYLKSRTAELITFGNAVAAANCSGSSRFVIRTGLRPDQLPDKDERGLKSPSMWMFAKRAGYRTIYIDGYATSKNTSISNHSFMNPSERDAIDVSDPIDSQPTFNRDMEIVDHIVDALKTDGPKFIFVEKNGAHYPYPKAYPPTFRGEEGAFPNPDLTNESDLKRSYRLAVQWSVDEFFKKLLPQIDLSDTLLIYTSDHGQNLFDGGYRLSHCSTTGNIHPSEAKVPLFAITKNASLDDRFRLAAKMGANRVSHFQLFPTMLDLMGYEPRFVAGFGRTLFDKPGPNQWQFFTGHIFGAVQGHRWIEGSR
ncbi:sulfatase-like hydrolase/transferase [Bradyrhizobium yuanmingense]|uniref:sulfatase-like hydrolase/transferase n=1 Tax=Bradyrhizobium yuanmingense TaxID=108015 RepID=UPI0023BA0A4D|nr:sulfatase-like hydrolase/transferase [Bradyrhizobium yuanmingense]MDF0585118.1 sulfatase-like hydrolase/transferase [Bradyrhizobium yuanmingense]